MKTTTPEISKILAPTDLSDSDLPALRYARLISDRFAAKLTLFYSDPIMFPVDAFGGPAPVMWVSPPVVEQERLREEAKQKIDPVMEGLPYELKIAAGQPIPAIVHAAEEGNADLIVMGTHARHGWRRAILGSVSEGVLHASRCPVLTVSREDPHTAGYKITKILCPINFSDVAIDSLRFAEQLASGFGAELVLVHVIEREEAKHKAIDEAEFRRWLAPLNIATSYRQLISRGGAAERVLDCADDLGVDLLVIGAQQRLFRDATVIGTTSERLVRFASCPVLVVPRPVGNARDAAKPDSLVDSAATW